MKCLLIVPVVVLLAWMPTSAATQTAPGSGFEDRTIQSVIAEQPPEFGPSADYGVSAKDFRTKAHVVFTGDVRDVTGKREDFLKIWVQTRGMPERAAALLTREARVRQGDTEYWIPFRKAVLDAMLKDVREGQPVDLYVILAGTYRQQDKVEWVFIAGGYSK
jgi:hypothetical protein